MKAQPCPNISSIASLQAKIESIRASIDMNSSPKSVTFYEDDSFAFEIDENGHEIARIKVSDRFKDTLQTIEAQKRQIISLRTSNQQLQKQLNALPEKSKQIRLNSSQQMEKKQELSIPYANLRNKFIALLEYLKPAQLYESLKKQLDQSPEVAHNGEVCYKVIEIPVQKEVVVEIPIQRIVHEEVPVYIERIVEVERPVIVERIVEVQKVIEVQKIVEVEVPVVTVVERIKQVPVEVDRIVQVVKQVEVPIEIERIVQVERLVEVPVDRIVYRDVPVEKTVIVEVEVPVEVELIREVIVEVEKFIEVQVDKIVQVPIQKIVETVVEVEVPVIVEKIIEAPPNQKEVEILKKQCEILTEKNNKQGEEISALKSLLETEVQLNHQSNAIITRLNQQIIQFSESGAVKKLASAFNNSTLQTQSSQINSNHSKIKDSSSANGQTMNRIKILTSFSKYRLPEKIRQYLRALQDQDLAEKMALVFEDLSQRAESQQRSNARWKQVVSQLDEKDSNGFHSLLQQAEEEKKALLAQLSAIKQENSQIRLQLQSQDSSNETEHLIEHLTSELQQQRTNNSQASAQNQHLRSQIERMQAQLSKKERQLSALLEQRQ